MDSGTRSGCSNTVSVTVKLMEERTAFPDEELERKTQSIINGTTTVTDPGDNCGVDSDFDAFTQANASDGASSRSSNISVHCP